MRKLVGIDSHALEVPFADHMIVLWYADRPGVIGVIGRLLGTADINVASMQVGRARAGGSALSVLTVDSVVPTAVLTRMAAEIGAERIRSVDLPGAR